MIELIDTTGKLSMNLLAEKMNEIIEALNTQPAEPIVQPRASKSLRPMTSEDAMEILLGELKDVDNIKASNILGLSYGQIYSARNGFTFKPVYKLYRDQLKAEELAASQTE